MALIKTLRDDRRLRLETLLKLRWFSLIGQGLAVLVAWSALGLAVPWAGIVMVLGVAVGFNLILGFRVKAILRVEEEAAFALLAADVVQVSGLLYLVGGISNPFSILFLAPVLISATALHPHRTVALGLIAMAGASIITIVPGYGSATPGSPEIRLSLWLALQFGIVFIGLYSWRMASDMRLRADALAAMELVLARERHLTQIDGLAAAAAHELGTPLGTIAVVVSELLRDTRIPPVLRDDLDLIKAQSERCRAILAEISVLGAELGDIPGDLAISDMIEEATARCRDQGIPIRISRKGEGDEPRAKHNPALIYGIGNLIHNAVEFASSEAYIAIEWSKTRLDVTISDDGPGLPDVILARFGEPYLTSRPLNFGLDDDIPARSGMGLGLFIARILIERSGASIEASNGISPHQGATICLSWPRHLFETMNRRFD